MSNRPAPPRIAVIGGGITGLAAAHRLVELSRMRDQPIALHLFETRSRTGGVITTERSDGYVIEGGPDSFLSEKPAALQLCHRLGIAGDLVGTREEFRRTYIARGTRLAPLPDGFLLMAPTRLWPLLTTPLFSWPGKLRMALDLVLPRRTPPTDESLADFVTRRLGREALERVAQPLVAGIYTADPNRLSLAATMPRFLEMERTERSIILAMWRQRRRALQSPADGSGARWSLFLSFTDGLQRLTDRLAAALPEGIVRLGVTVSPLGENGAGWRVGEDRYDAVIVAVPAPAAAALLRDRDPLLAGELAAIEYASSAVVTLAFRREDIPHPLDGFGFVVPHTEGRALLAGTFSSLKYPGRCPEELVLIRAFVGGALQPTLLELDDTTLIGRVREELGVLLGIEASPELVRIARWPRSMPQYHLGHRERVARIRTRAAALPRLELAGNAYDGIGIPDCIRSGEQAAEHVLARMGS
jgi:oxygen-dependent protoporphyrinogen oxidase